MSALVAAARSRLGVRFRHRGRTERGVDCAGLVWLAYHDCGVDLPDFVFYSTEPSAHGPGLTHHVSAALGEHVLVAPVVSQQLLPGDVVVMRFQKEPHHVGIVGDYCFGGPSLIHAYGEVGRAVETRFADDMVARITHVFRKPV